MVPKSTWRVLPGIGDVKDKAVHTEESTVCENMEA